MQPLIYTAKPDIYTNIGIGVIERLTEHAPKNQSLSARQIAAALAGHPLVIEKDESGKPYVADSNLHLSLTHSKHLAAAIVSTQSPVGIDLEAIHPRIERIAHKFLTPQELDAITSNRVETLLLYWSAKEALYKLYAKKQLEFATQLIVEPFQLQQSGTLKSSIIVPDEQELFADLDVHYEFLEGHIMAYVLGR